MYNIYIEWHDPNIGFKKVKLNKQAYKIKENADKALLKFKSDYPDTIIYVQKEV